KPRTLEVRVNGRTTRLLVSDVSFAYCRQQPAVCAAIKSSQEKDLTPNQRKAVDGARQTIKNQQNAPEPAPLPSPEPAPVGREPRAAEQQHGVAAGLDQIAWRTRGGGQRERRQRAAEQRRRQRVAHAETHQPAVRPGAVVLARELVDGPQRRRARPRVGEIEQ